MATIYAPNGTKKGTIDLPAPFKQAIRPDLIQRAVVAHYAQARTPYGVTPAAGLTTSAAYFGNRRHTYRLTINRGQSRLPREKPGGGGLGRVRRVPQSVGGRRAHPPKGADTTKKINKKEYHKALEAAIAASADASLVAARGHATDGVKEFPLIVDDAFAGITTTREAKKALTALGLAADLARVTPRRTTGKAKLRGRRKRTSKSLLVVIDEDKGIKQALANLPGVDVTTVADLSVADLAPGTHAGRLTLWTNGAIEKLGQ